MGLSPPTNPGKPQEYQEFRSDAERMAAFVDQCEQDSRWVADSYQEFVESLDRPPTELEVAIWQGRAEQEYRHHQQAEVRRERELQRALARLRLEDHPNSAMMRRARGARGRERRSSCTTRRTRSTSSSSASSGDPDLGEPPGAVWRLLEVLAAEVRWRLKYQPWASA